MSSHRVLAAVAAACVIAVPAEGLRQWAYLDPPGILTVCWGSTTNVVAGRKYSLAECVDRLDSDMLNAVHAVDRCRPGLPPSVLAAFADAAFNIGPKVACDSTKSTAARLLEQGRYAEACNQLLRWNKAWVASAWVELPGLTKRRAAENRLCLTDLPANPPSLGVVG